MSSDILDYLACIVYTFVGGIEDLLGAILNF